VAIRKTAGKKAVKSKTAGKKAVKSKTKHKHRVGAKPGIGAVGGLLKSLNKGAEKKGKKKSEKPIIVLEGEAASLLRIQQAKALYKTLEGEIKTLEADLLPVIEDERVSINQAKREYIGSVHVQATGEDEHGKPINAGQAVYYVQNRYSAWNSFEASSDDELQEDYDGEATLRTEAIHAIRDALIEEGEKKISLEDAESILDDRIKISHALTLDEGVLAMNPDGTPAHPEIIAILQEHLAEHLVSKTKVLPTEAFHKQSNYDPRERAIMQGLNNIGLCHRSKAVLKPSGAPKQ